MSWRLVFPFMKDYPVITPDDISAFEARNQLKLPADYVAYLLEFRGSSPIYHNDEGRYRAVEYTVDWEGKPAQSYGDECGLESTFSIFEGKEIDSPYKGGCDLDDNIVWNRHLHPPGLLPIGMDAGNSLFLLGVEGDLTGRVFFLSTFHVPDPISFEHIGHIAPTFTDFLQVGHPAGSSRSASR
ncbi:SMI1/KNR4 family protein [Roseateles depolymerans]|uniref:Uncharacterized protein n=1 Tax=Roseateles depolymerans TaxID=76731 RepID=A0A0U3MTI3_9BURK|nr:SMI1/KNR4 family protein [Roseateles depolymerans]ALV05172.1 hypothetical protein RD2015_676 [Roseateles depolymerans]REG14812.1 SMI1/KNR4 family protein SUKH-1 [Roseateles depolymerans]